MLTARTGPETRAKGTRRHCYVLARPQRQAVIPAAHRCALLLAALSKQHTMRYQPCPVCCAHSTSYHEGARPSGHMGRAPLLPTRTDACVQATTLGLLEANKAVCASARTSAQHQQLAGCVAPPGIQPASAANPQTCLQCTSGKPPNSQSPLSPRPHLHSAMQLATRPLWSTQHLPATPMFPGWAMPLANQLHLSPHCVCQSPRHPRPCLQPAYGWR